MNTPDFIGIGAQKAGTSWVHACLHEHPEISMPASKEVHFFSKYYDRGGDWYVTHLPKASPGKVVGEFSPTYLYSCDAPSRICSYNPNVKLIVCLRDPVDRARSAYRYAIQHGKISRTIPLNEVIARRPAFVEHSLYYSQIARYLEYFKREQLHVVPYEHMILDPVATMQSIYKFVGVDSGFVPSMAHRKVNESKGEPRVRFLEWCMRRSAAFLRKAGHGHLAWRIARSRTIEVLRTLNNRPPALSELEPKIESELRKLFAADICDLSLLLKQDLHQLWPGYAERRVGD